MTVQLSDDEWKTKLTDEQYRILREKGTELPGSGRLLHNTRNGDYACAACGQVVFESDSKYDSVVPGLIGWPSFSEAASREAVKLVDDTSNGMQRVEVVCSNCGSHLGHLFSDKSSPSGLHFCINSAALGFEDKVETNR
jgi:peptide-methionine (R)-S-oxide reductase